MWDKAGPRFLRGGVLHQRKTLSPEKRTAAGHDGRKKHGSAVSSGGQNQIQADGLDQI